MNYIKESEEILKVHRKLYYSLQTLNKRRKKLVFNGAPKMPGAIEYNKPAIQHMDYSEDTFNDMCEIMDINRQIAETEEEMKIVNDILEEIKKEDITLETFLRLKYITDYKKSMGEIAQELGYSSESTKTIYNIKTRALREFAIRYFGARGAKSV